MSYLKNLVFPANYALRVNRYVLKPVDLDDFREAVHALALTGLLLDQAPPRHAFTGGTEKSA